MAVTLKCRCHLVTVFFSNGFLKTFQECFVFYMQREVMAEDEVKLVNVSYCRNNNNYVKISNDPCNGDVVFLLLCLSVCLLSVIDYFALLCWFFLFCFFKGIKLP